MGIFVYYIMSSEKSFDTVRNLKVLNNYNYSNSDKSYINLTNRNNNKKYVSDSSTYIKYKNVLNSNYKSFPSTKPDVSSQQIIVGNNFESSELYIKSDNMTINDFQINNLVETNNPGNT